MFFSSICCFSFSEMKFLSSILIVLTATSTARGLHSAEFTDNVHQPEKEHLSISNNTSIKSANCDPTEFSTECTKKEVGKPLQSTVQPEKQHIESPTNIHTLNGQQTIPEEKPPQSKLSGKNEKNDVPKVDKENTPIKSANCDTTDCTKNEVGKPLQSTVQPERQHAESPTTIHTLNGQQKMTEENPPQLKPSEKNEVPKVDERSAITNCTYEPEITSTKQTAPPTKATTTPEVETTSVPSPCIRVWPKCMKDQLDTTFNEIVADMMTFTLNLFQKISSLDSRPNLAISPISVALVLSQLMLGADGKTKEVLLSTLYKGVKDHDCIHNALKSLTINDAFLSASEIFYNKELHINNEFLNQSLRFYNTKGKPLSNNEKEGLETINSWISSKTNKLIPSLLQELPPDLQLLLVNVLYYQGKWVSQFDPSHTKKETFHRSSSDSVKVRMMNGHKYPLQSLRVSYLHAQVARFPLTDNSSLLIFLPISQDPSALNKMEKKLNQEIVEDLIKQLEEIQPRATSVSLPQLKLDTSIDLIEPLRLLDKDGLYYLFDDPNLCALSNNTSLAISDIRHRVVLEVKEEGVKAAVATTVSVARSITVFAVRRPFLFILVSGKSRIPILIGHVNDPSQ